MCINGFICSVIPTKSCSQCPHYSPKSLSSLSSVCVFFLLLAVSLAGTHICFRAFIILLIIQFPYQPWQYNKQSPFSQTMRTKMWHYQCFQLISLLATQTLLPHLQGQPGNFYICILSITKKSHSLSHFSYRSKQKEPIIFGCGLNNSFVAEIEHELAFLIRGAPIALP